MKNVLTPKQYLYIQMYYIDGLQMSEIAKQKNVNVSTVSRTIDRAVRRLRDKISPLSIGEATYILSRTKWGGATNDRPVIHH